MTALFALAGALIVGASDFGGGLASRSAPALRVTSWVQGASFAALFVVVWFFDAPSITGADLTAGAVAGLSGTFSFAALYASFSRGQISLLAPTAAIVGAVVPTVVGFARGDELKGLQLLGIVVALLAVVLVTQEPRLVDQETTTSPQAFALAIVAGLGFSIFFLALAETNEDAGLWPLIAARVVSVPAVIAVALVATKGIRLHHAATRWLAIGAGVAEGISNVFVLWAFQRGPIAVAAVLGAFYPVSTVLLARVVLAERLQRIQWAGVALALAAIPLIAAA